MGEEFMSYHPDPVIRDYEDRGMAKWIGFYLSEHTAEMTKVKTAGQACWERRPSMSESEISAVLEEAYLKRYEVTIQLGALNADGQAFPDIIGIAEGTGDRALFLSTLDQGIQIIPYNTIQHITIGKKTKWSSLEMGLEKT